MDIGQSIKPTLLGAAIGAVAVAAIGFSALDWRLGSSAERMADERADAAIVSVLTPICVERFQQQSDYPAKLAELKNAAVWTRRTLIEKAGWATLPGTDKTHSLVAKACAEKLGTLS